MPGRASKLAFGAGSVVLLVLAIGLVRLTRSVPPAAPPVPAHAATTASPAPVAEPAAPAPAPLAVREQAPATPRGVAARRVAQPELAPAPGSFTRELKRDADGNLVPIIPREDLQALLFQAEAPMKACIERSGQHPTGKAMLSFTVAAKNNKLVIDTTGVQDEETLAGYPGLLACMHQTANALVLEGRPVPELGTPIYVRRLVRLDNGALAEDLLVSFSYNP